MGRKRKTRILDIYVGQTKVGAYTRAASGATAFRYDAAWLSSERAFPISLSMPLSDRAWVGEMATSYFDGLLPDDQVIREKIAAREHAESAGTFDLLAVIGRDCVGALRLVPEGEDPGNPRLMNYRPVGDKEIGKRISSLGRVPLGIHTGDESGEDDFRISIAGVQEKTAFLRIGSQWHLPLGPTPTSHIFKPAMMLGPNGADFSDTPWNEWLCLNICQAFGLEAAQAEVLIFDDKPVIVIERFDRHWLDDVLYRLPQEDLCQALSVPPSRKYQNDGGPSVLDVLAFLNGAVVPREDRLKFVKAQILFWLLAAVDGHAKNFSIFLAPGGYSLTPVYDVMSAAPYLELSPHKIKLAMSVGNNRHYRVKGVLPRHFYQTALKAGIQSEDIDEIFSDLVDQKDRAISEVIEQATAVGVPELMTGSIIEGFEHRLRLWIEEQIDAAG